MKFPTIALLALVSFGLNAQQKFDFKLSDSVKVMVNGAALANPWSGGINFATFNTADLDFDGTDELIVFDRSARSITVFRKNTSSNSPSGYKHAPELDDFFRPDNWNDVNWILMRDFNCDGKKDLFFSVINNIYVMENTSSGGNLSFTPHNGGKALESDFGRIPTASVNLPAISDVDNDGDIDIVSWDTGALRMSKHDNQSACGLNFVTTENCYGDFQETGLTKDVTLDACGYGKKAGSEGTLHVGGSALILELNDDNLPDLLLGNISFNNITALFNDGSLDTANFNRQDTAWPNSKPANLFQFTSSFYEDVTHDGVPDLLVSSTDNSTRSAFKNTRNIWLYENKDRKNNPDFDFKQKDFLQEEMIDLGSSSVPRFADLNGDSLMDLVVAVGKTFTKPSYFKSELHYYENTGTAQLPEFTLVDTNLAELSKHSFGYNIIPTFGDLDGDGDLDMIIGGVAGSVHELENKGSTMNPDFVVKNAILNNIDAGSFAAPYLFDFDGDGDLDLFIGNQSGKVHYYKNSSATTANFSLVNDFFGAINVTFRNFLRGYAQPVLFKDSLDNTQIFVGSNDRGVVSYADIDQVAKLPVSFIDTIGKGTIKSSNFKETPLGISRPTGRNQFLIKAAELKAKGFQYGFIRNIALELDVNDAQRVQNGFNLRMKNVNLDSLTVFDNSPMTEVVTLKSQSFGNGWNIIDLDEEFLWDGKSDLLVEFCFSNNFTTPDRHVKMHTTPFKSHVYGDITNHNIFGADGCTMPSEKAIQRRPNMQIRITPAAREHQSKLARARRLSADYADLNNDGFMDAIVGNAAGGLNFYKGKKYESNVGLPENRNPTLGFEIFPNPSSGSFAVQLSGAARGAYHTVQVYDISGQLLYHQELTQAEQTVPFKAKPGVYLVVVTGDAARKTEKLLVQ